jgi:hypothetical protein
MSADNQVRIIEKNGEYFIRDCFIEDDTSSGGLIGKTNNLREAIAMAQEYMSHEIVEYGMSIRLENKS